MMLRLIFFIKFLSLCLQVQAQKYSFDYVIEAESRALPDSQPERLFYYINSKDNSYLLTANYSDNVQARIHFIAVNDEIVAVINAPLADNNPEGVFDLNFKPARLKNPFRKKQLKNYDYKVFQDTLIDGTYYRHYKIYHKDKEVAAKKGILEMHYIVAKQPDVLPVLLPFTAPYVVWEVNKNVIPKGLSNQNFMVKPDGQKINFTKFKSYSKINKTLLIE